MSVHVLPPSCVKDITPVPVLRFTCAEAQRAAEANVIGCRMMASAAVAVRVVAVLAMPSRPVAVLVGWIAANFTETLSITSAPVAAPLTHRSNVTPVPVGDAVSAIDCAPTVDGIVVGEVPNPLLPEYPPILKVPALRVFDTTV